MQPTPYTPQHSNVELSAIALTLGEILDNLAIIQRDDTGLMDEIVTTESLSPNVRALFGAMGRPRGAWISLTQYEVKDVVETGSPLIAYICVTAHLSGTFSIDRNDGKWMVVSSAVGESGLGIFPVGVITPLVGSSTGATVFQSSGANQWAIDATTGHLRPISANHDLGTTGDPVRTGVFGTSVVTPVVGTATNTDFFIKHNNQNRYVFNNGYAAPVDDNFVASGQPDKRWTAVFALSLDSGTTGSLSLKTNNGIEALRVVNIASAVNFISMGGAVTGSRPFIRTSQSSDANTGLELGTRGTGSVVITTRADTLSLNTQLEMLDVNSVTRWVTIAGSNGGNPTISTTAGSLAITPSVVIAGTSISIGSPASSVGGVRVVNGSNGGLWARNIANSSDIRLVDCITKNGVNDVVGVGNNGGSGVLLQARSGAGAPTTSDLASGEWALWRDTSGGTTKVYYNNAGSIQNVALA